MQYNFTDAVIDVARLRRTDAGYVFGFEVKPTDGTPYHSGYVEASNHDTAAAVAHGAYWSNNLKKYQQNAYGF